MPNLEILTQHPCTVCGIQHNKAVEKTETIGDLVCEMESVPNIIQLTENEADVQKDKHQTGTDLITHLNALAGQEQKCQNIRGQTAVDVGKAFLISGGHQHIAVASHLTHGIKNAFPCMLIRNVQPELLGELVDAGLGGLQCGQRRQLQKCSHADGEDGKQADPQEIQNELFEGLPAANLVADKQQQNENAGKEANIIVGCHRQEQTDRIKNKFLLI